MNPPPKTEQTFAHMECVYPNTNCVYPNRHCVYLVSIRYALCQSKYDLRTARLADGAAPLALPIFKARRILWLFEGDVGEAAARR